MNKREKAVLPLLLKELRLPTINRLWEDFAIEAEGKGWPCPRYLSNLCEQERFLQKYYEKEVVIVHNLRSISFEMMAKGKMTTF